MARPEDNEAGYRHDLATAGWAVSMECWGIEACWGLLLFSIENLRHKKFMVNHGMADDTIHYQHFVNLSESLQKENIQFVQHSYPGESHGLKGVSK